MLPLPAPACRPLLTGLELASLPGLLNLHLSTVLESGGAEGLEQGQGSGLGLEFSTGLIIQRDAPDTILLGHCDSAG